MMWKPTKAGVYLWCNRAREVVVEPWGEIIVGHGPWSLLAPEWQDGAPTVAQLMQWPWWAIWGGSGQMMVAGMVAELRLDYVLRSAPIQPDLNNGPLWVPLEVVK